jgi:hypothetical protein
LARARTFTLLEEVDEMRAAGLAQGGSLDNAVVVDQAKVLNPAGLRMPDEFVRHKLLDAVGDLALAGAPLRPGMLVKLVVVPSSLLPAPFLVLTRLVPLSVVTVLVFKLS